MPFAPHVVAFGDNCPLQLLQILKYRASNTGWVLIEYMPGRCLLACRGLYL